MEKMRKRKIELEEALIVSQEFFKNICSHEGTNFWFNESNQGFGGYEGVGGFIAIGG